MTNQKDEKYRDAMKEIPRVCEISQTQIEETPRPIPPVADLPTDDLPSPDEEHRRLYEERRRQRYGINRC